MTCTLTDAAGRAEFEVNVSGGNPVILAAMRTESRTMIPVSPGVKRSSVIFLVVAGGLMWWPVAAKLLGSPPGFLRDLGFVSGPQGTVLAWCLGLVVAVVYATYAVRNIPLVRGHWRAASPFKVLGILAAVSAAVVEEAFFRRVFMDEIMGPAWPTFVQVVASGLVFAVAHGIWGIMTRRVAVGIGTMIATGTVGTALAIVYVVGDRSLAPVIVSHFIITATIQPGITFAAFSGHMRKGLPPSLN